LATNSTSLSNQGEPAAPLIRLGTVRSTMEEAARLAKEGYPHGPAVTAEEQTAGIGRQGHSWHSEQGSGLYVSILLRLPLAPDALPLLTLALGLATAEAITTATGILCDIRWPNDIMIGGKKAAGILAQFVDSAVVAGIGINVNHAQFPPELANQATSLRLFSGKREDRESLLLCLLSAVQNACEALSSGGKAAILKMFGEASSYVFGKQVRVDLGEREIQGVTEGLTNAGFLLVRTAEGKLETVIAGGVRPLELPCS
jgi:BirA family transcriptional regulator, biotin operon repressor / biotin---[acetyl-CoA-carboxylase] ligase